MYTVALYNKQYNVEPRRTTYEHTGELAVILYDDEGCFADITVCLPNKSFELDNDMAFIDVNNCPWAIEFLENNNIAVFTGVYVHSGFVQYPLYKFNLEVIKSWD